MKTKSTVLILAVALLLPFSSRAVTNLQISIQSSNVILTFPSVEGEFYILEHRSTLNTNTPWEIVTNYIPAAVGTNRTSFVHSNQVTPTGNFGGGGSGGGAGGPPSPGFASSDSSSSDSKKTPVWELEGREPEAWEKENRPAYPWEAETLNALHSFQSANFSSAESESNEPQGAGDGGTGMEMGFYFVVGYGEDTDGDGTDNITELVIGSDPLVPEDDGTPLNDGGVYSGEVNITFTPSSSYTNILGPMLYADGVLANSLITTEPSPGNLRLQWHSVFVHTGAAAFTSGSPSAAADGPVPNFTIEESDLLADAFGQGTKTTGNIISKPNQAKIDLLPRELLERYEKFASASVKSTFQLIQKANKGTYVPAGGLESFMRLRIAFVHTQFTRMQSIASSLTRRFGRAANKVLPFAGGIIILANADNISANFLSAMNDYARDIANGEDETGSAAILAGRCNDLAPGSGNIVLNYLLR